MIDREETLDEILGLVNTPGTQTMVSSYCGHRDTLIDVSGDISCYDIVLVTSTGERILVLDSSGGRLKVTRGYLGTKTTPIEAGTTILVIGSLF